MILPILAYGHPILKKYSEEIKENTPELQKLISDMFDTMDNAKGVGLAAPQVGQNIRIFVIDLDPFGDKTPEYKKFKKAYINLHILKEEGEEWAYDEGCLSVPGITENVYRKPKITIEYDDIDFNHHIETADGMMARVIQHEHEHLEGHIFTENLSSLKRTMLSKKLENISRGKMSGRYKMIFPRR
jgi:peptide deformylase